MLNTKEKILRHALHLFAKDGYEAVSISMIAKKIGITKGALYKHYVNKRDIFNSIVERMYALDGESADKYSVPREEYETDAGSYDNVTLDSLRNFTVAQFSFWTENEFAADFRRMLTIEQYRNAEMSELYGSCITSGPVRYTEDIFRKMIESGILIDTDPKQLAVEFYSPLFLIICMFDFDHNKERSLKLLNEHIDRFVMFNSSNR